MTAAAAASTSATLVSALATLLSVTLALLLLVADQVGRGQSLGQVDLGSDGVGQVADHENVLDVVVEVVLNLRSVDLGGQRQGAQEVLSQGIVGLLVLIQYAVNPLADAVQKANGLLDRSTQALNV